MHSGSSAIRVLIVDDHDLFRTGLASYLDADPNLEVVAQASSGRMGVKLASELEPDVVVLDLRMPDMHGTDATRTITRSRPATRVVILTVSATDNEVTAVLHAGACGFLIKDTPIADVATAVRAAASGSAWLSPGAADAVLNQIRRQSVAPGDPVPDLKGLSAREIEVLQLLGRGLENSAIAEQLEISPSTAKNHVSSVLTKLGLPNRIQAAIYAVRNELS